MKINKNIIISVITTIFLLSALVYNLLYINNKKNEIIEEIEIEEVKEKVKEEKEKIYVHIAGAVNNPGLYELEEGSRVNDLVNLAGGFLNTADITDVNLAYILTDAIKVTIPVKEKVVKKTAVITNKISSTSDNTSKQGGLININNANSSELEKLNGVGEATAKKIIEYRDKNGGFKSVEELKNVSGIGEAKYKKIVENVTI